MISKVIEWLASEASLAAPDIRCYIGELPTTAPAICLQQAGGASVETYHDTRRLMRCALSLFVRFASQKDALDALDAIQHSLVRRTDWLDDDDLQITSVSASTLPNWIRQEERSDYLYAMGLEVWYYERDDIL